MKLDYKKKLLEEIHLITEEIERLKPQTIPVKPDNSIGRLTRMDAINSKSIAEANLRSAERRLQRMKAIVERIDRGDEEVGLCGLCGEQIPWARLLARPESTCCVECVIDKG